MKKERFYLGTNIKIPVFDMRPIDEWNRLEEEPPLFTRDEVIEHMLKAITLYGLTGKEPRKSELYSLLSK